MVLKVTGQRRCRGYWPDVLTTRRASTRSSPTSRKNWPSWTRASTVTTKRCTTSCRTASPANTSTNETSPAGSVSTNMGPRPWPLLALIFSLFYFLLFCDAFCGCPAQPWIKSEVYTHKSAKTHAGNIFVTRDLDLWPFDPKINKFSGLILEH